MKYIDLDVWLKSRELVTNVCQFTRDFPQTELYSLINQIRRSAVSVPSNIAEGCGRQTAKDTTHFLYISRGSLYGLETQIYLSLDLGYINKEDCNILIEKITVCKKLINGFINYFKNK